MPLTQFHPAILRWFTHAFESPTEIQRKAWPVIQCGKPVLITAPTGSGKTLAAFLAIIDDLLKQRLAGTLHDETQVVYISPLKALSNDIEKNLQLPLSGIQAELQNQFGIELNLRVAVRTGDTPPSKRAAMLKKPPHILVTTPESLYILLTSDGGRNLLRPVRTVIVDEIHALAPSKRGTHLSLSLERLDALTRAKTNRIGLSATQKPLDLIGRFLLGTETPTIIDCGHRREMDLALELPRSPLEAVMAGEVWDEIYERLTALIRAHRTTLVFVNTRRMAERLAHQLSTRLGDDNVAAHHGSLARDKRLDAEQKLKSGALKVLVATASLELGIDIGEVDLVCQIGSPKSIAAFLQRIGRSGHRLHQTPKGRLFPLSRDELVECVALLHAVERGELDAIEFPLAPLDILAQQIVAEVACEPWSIEELFAAFRRAFAYRDLSRKSFDDVIQMLADGFTTRRGRRGALIHHDAINQRLRGRKGAKLVAVSAGGAIPELADYDVILEPEGTFLGTVNEDFAVESMAGDIFQLGNTSWEILRVERSKVLVADAKGKPPTLPFWLGEAPSRTRELSHAVSELRRRIADRYEGLRKESLNDDEIQKRLIDEFVSNTIDIVATEQFVAYLIDAYRALNAMPTQETIVLERFFDESGGMQLIVHSPYGMRVNRAWGLGLRKRFCRSFNFELQAAATEDAIVLSLGMQHSFPLDDVFSFLHSNTAKEIVIQAMLDSPIFTTRWRWNANRSLAIPRFRNGKKVPAPLQRMQSEDLVAAVFPDQLACLENIIGDREIPDHPLVEESIKECLTQAMDIERFLSLLKHLERDQLKKVARDLPTPSPLAQEILSARPYAFLDDAPLEERRTQAVQMRRTLDPKHATSFGKLDEAAIDLVKQEAWPNAETADELHDALMLLGFIDEHNEIDDPAWNSLFQELIAERRGAIVITARNRRRLWVATERLSYLRTLLPHATLAFDVALPKHLNAATPTLDDAWIQIVRGRLEGLGPTTAREILESLDLDPERDASRIESVLQTLESHGVILRGHFTAHATDEKSIEWCERGLLARIHRYTLDRLRKAIEPVSAADFFRFLCRWQHVGVGNQIEGIDGLSKILSQLEGVSASAVAWEREILPSRVKGYTPSWLDHLSFSGTVVWRCSRDRKPSFSETDQASSTHRRSSWPMRTIPTMLLSRDHHHAWQRAPINNGESFSSSARTVFDCLDQRGALFFDELRRHTTLLPTQLEEAIAELVALGFVTADSFRGLRFLSMNTKERERWARLRSRGGFASAPLRSHLQEAGRWSLLLSTDGEVLSTEERLETIARTLLRRYGIVFRRVLERESNLPPWRELLYVYRRWEAQGVVRGGRFVAGFSGEQFALPEAIGALRQPQILSNTLNPEHERETKLLIINAADPLNLVGVLTPGSKIPSAFHNRIVFQNGIPVAVKDGRTLDWLTELSAEAQRHIQAMVTKSPSNPSLRVYFAQ